MKILFVLIAVLVLLFSFGVSGYISFFRIPVKALTARILAFVMLGTVAAAVTFALCFSIVWPPVMM